MRRVRTTNCSATRLRGLLGRDVAVARRRSGAASSVPTAGDGLEVAVDRRGALEHHAAQLERSASPASTCSVQRESRSRLRIFWDFAYVQAQHSPSRIDVPERHQVRPAVAADGRAGQRALLVEEGAATSSAAHRDLRRGGSRRAGDAGPRRRRARPRGRRRARARRRRRPPSSTSRTRNSMPLKVISTMIRPSGSSARTVRCSRAQRACSAEISTRATREPPTVPVRGQPSMSAIGFRPSRRSKRLDERRRALDPVQPEVAQLADVEVPGGDVPAPPGR